MFSELQKGHSDSPAFPAILSGIDDSIEVIIPEFAASKWMNSNQVGIKETIVTDNGNQMTLFVEEDLPRKRKEKQ